MPSIPYTVLRGLELEGRSPSDHDSGGWPITVCRLEIGEGLPKDGSRWASVVWSDGQPIGPPPRPPRSVLKANRRFYYQRIRTAEECIDYFKGQGDPLAVMVACQITTDWGEPIGGIIPIPDSTRRVLRNTHVVGVFNAFPDRSLFQFINWWGKDWGDRGTGYITFEYFDRYVFEAWTTYAVPNQLRHYQSMNIDDDNHICWSARDHADRVIHGFEVHDQPREERLAWTFAVERDGALEIEDLFVMPEFRRVGHGQWLADRLIQLSREKAMPLRLWVPFTDCKSVNRSNYPALVAISRRLSLGFKPCPVPWAAYFGTTEGGGVPTPIEPLSIPERPRSTREAVLAAALALTALSPNGANGPSHLPATIEGQEHPITVGSAEWDRLTERRAELIYKKNRQGLNAAEQEEFDRLQRQNREVITRAFPAARLQSLSTPTED